MPERDGYDLEMIRDFLDQLLWEVRVSHFDNTNEKPNNPELAEQLKKYQRKYGRTLVPFIKLQTDGLTAEQIDKGRQHLRARVAEVRQDQLDALEFLQPLFDFALIAAAKPSSIESAPVMPVRVDQIDRL
jgi:hypothetical protein